MGALILLLTLAAIGFALWKSIDQESRRRAGFLVKLLIGIIVLGLLWAWSLGSLRA